MFITDKLAYLQLQKTACTHIARVMAQTIEGQQLGKHHRVEPAQLDLESRIIIGSIRNPWDWYVSLWAYGSREVGGIYSKLQRRRIKKHLPYLKSHSADFLTGVMCESQKQVEHWASLYQDANDPKYFRLWLTNLLSAKKRFDADLRFGYSGTHGFSGLMSFRYCYLYWRDIKKLLSANSITSYSQFYELDCNDNMLDCAIRMEQLEPDLISALEQAGYLLSKPQQEAIFQAKPSNTSSHSQSGYYYDQETLELVATKEKLIIDKYHYQAPKLPS